VKDAIKGPDQYRRLRTTITLTKVAIRRALDLNIRNGRIDLGVDLIEERLSLGIARHETRNIPDGGELRFGIDDGLIRVVRAFCVYIWTRR
jgi:hypothetical protein